MFDFYSLASEFLLEVESSRHSVPPPAWTPLICRCLCQKLDYMSWKIHTPSLSAYNKLKVSVCSYSAHCGAIKWNIRAVPFSRFKQMCAFFFPKHLQIQHEMRSVPKWGGDAAEQKQTEALGLNMADLNSCKNQMTCGHYGSRYFGQVNGGRWKNSR